MLLIVPFKFCNLETAISGKKKRRRRADDVGIKLYSARIGSIRVPAYGQGVGRTCANNLFLALEKQALAGPVFQIRSRHFELQDVIDQLHLLLFVRVSSRHSSNGPLPSKRAEPVPQVPWIRLHDRVDEGPGR